MALRGDLRRGLAIGAAALGAIVLALALATTLIMAAPAWAEDTFYFRNETGERFTPNDQDGLEEGCWFEAGGVFDTETGSAASLSSITAEAHAFECNSMWGVNLGYEQDPIEATRENGERFVGAWWGGIGAFGFDAYDPWIGSSTLQCEANGREWEEGNYMSPIEGLMTAEVDGRTCTISWLPGVTASARLGLASTSARAYAGHVRFVSSLASVLGDHAKVSVQVFGRGAARHRTTVTLRTRAGRRIGSSSRILRVGDRSRVIDVPLSAAAARELSAGGELEVKAAVAVSSRGGSGDTTSQLLLRRGLSGRR